MAVSPRRPALRLLNSATVFLDTLLLLKARVLWQLPDGWVPIQCIKVRAINILNTALRPFLRGLKLVAPSRLFVDPCIVLVSSSFCISFHHSRLYMINWVQYFRPLLSVSQEAGAGRV